MSPRRSAPCGPPVSTPRPGPIGPARMPPRQALRISTGCGGSTRRRKRPQLLYHELAEAGPLRAVRLRVYRRSGKMKRRSGRSAGAVTGASQTAGGRLAGASMRPDRGRHGRLGRRQDDHRRRSGAPARLAVPGRRRAASAGERRQDACRHSARRCGSRAVAARGRRQDRRMARAGRGRGHYLLGAETQIPRHRLSATGRMCVLSI